MTPMMTAKTRMTVNKILNITFNLKDFTLIPPYLPSVFGSLIVNWAP